MVFFYWRANIGPTTSHTRDVTLSDSYSTIIPSPWYDIYRNIFFLKETNKDLGKVQLPFIKQWLNYS